MAARAMALLAVLTCVGVTLQGCTKGEAATDLVQGTQLQCIGRIAHRVNYTLDRNEFIAVSVDPVPDRNNECSLDGRLGSKDRHICIGLNQDATCAAGKAGVLPLPFGARCQDCFVGMETDLFFSVNISRFHVHYVGVGLRDTQLHSKVQIMDDKAGGNTPKRRSIKFGGNPHEWQLKVLGHRVATFRVSMPSELYYENAIHANGHTDVGANFDINFGENSVKYHEGKGWEHHRDKAEINLHPIVEADDNVQGNLKFGITTSVQVEVVDVMWFHLNLDPEINTKIVAIGSSASSDLVHSCVTGGLNFDASHEAAINVSIMNHTVKKHFGPAVDKHYSNPNVTHRCFDIHRKKPESTVV